MNPIEQAHNILRNVLLNGRISLNGQPLTANELNTICTQENILFNAAMSKQKEQEPVPLKE